MGRCSFLSYCWARLKSRELLRNLSFLSLLLVVFPRAGPGAGGEGQRYPRMHRFPFQASPSCSDISLRARSWLCTLPKAAELFQKCPQILFFQPVCLFWCFCLGQVNLLFEVGVMQISMCPANLSDLFWIPKALLNYLHFQHTFRISQPFFRVFFPVSSFIPAA